MAGLPPSQLFRLSHAAGQAKQALAAEPELPGGRLAEIERHRWFLDEFRHRLGPREAEARAWARRELDRARQPEGASLRRFLAGVGLKTIARSWTGANPSDSLGLAACALPRRQTDPLRDALDSFRRWA